MSDALQSARVKLARANLHASIGNREFRRFIKKHPRPTMRIESETDVEAAPVGSIIRLDLVLNRGFPDPPDSFAARFGDAIHNYRSALDHIAWQLVKHGKDPNPSEPHKVQFPINFKRRNFRDELATRLPGVDTRKGGPCEFIESRHRYKGGNARNHTLMRLARLSNDDKHRSLHLMFAAALQAKHRITFWDCRPIGFEMPSERPKLVPDAVIGHPTIEVTGSNPDVGVKPSMLVYIALEDWTNMLEVLAEIRAEVTEIINAPQILRAL